MEQHEVEILARASRALVGVTSTEEVATAGLHELKLAMPGTRWALLVCVSPGRYRAFATGSTDGADIRVLASLTLPRDCFVCTHTVGGTTSLGMPGWQVKGSNAQRPTLVLATWDLPGVRSANSALTEELASLFERAIESARMVESLRTQTSRDDLTRTLNRKAVLEQLELERHRSLRYHRSLSVLFIDVDRFKQINDRYGHSAGDRALIHIARSVENELRVSDVLGRVGGDEFLVLLPDTSLEAAHQVARRIETIMRQTPVPHEPDPITVSVTVGTASTDEGKELDVVDVSDRRMLDRKQKRRWEGPAGDIIPAAPRRATS